LEPVIQNNPQPPSPGGDQDHIAALEAQIEALNVELLCRRPGQPNPEMNMDEHEEEDRNSNTNPRREDDRQGTTKKTTIGRVSTVEVTVDTRPTSNVSLWQRG
jgi:hypothetical protein